MKDKKYYIQFDINYENHKDVFVYYYIDNDNLKLLSEKLDKLAQNHFQDDYEPINIMLDKYKDDEFIEKVPLRIDTRENMSHVYIDFIFDGQSLEINDEEYLDLIRVLNECQLNDECDGGFIYKALSKIVCNREYFDDDFYIAHSIYEE